VIDENIALCLYRAALQLVYLFLSFAINITPLCGMGLVERSKGA